MPVSRKYRNKHRNRKTSSRSRKMSKSKNAKRSRKNKKMNQRGGEGECTGAEITFINNVNNETILRLANWKDRRVVDCNISKEIPDCTFYEKNDENCSTPIYPPTENKYGKGTHIRYKIN
jgi:hypothetical protein